MCVCVRAHARTCVHAHMHVFPSVQVEIRAEESVLSFHSVSPGMELRSSCSAAGAFTHWARRLIGKVDFFVFGGHIFTLGATKLGYSVSRTLRH